MRGQGIGLRAAWSPLWGSTSTAAEGKEGELRLFVLKGHQQKGETTMYAAMCGNRSQCVSGVRDYNTEIGHLQAA